MVKITDKFYIDADNHCYILKEKTIVQDQNSKNYGKELYKDLGYYTSLENLLKGISKDVTRRYINKNDVGIKELTEEIKRQEKYIESLDLRV